MINSPEYDPIRRHFINDQHFVPICQITLRHDQCVVSIVCVGARDRLVQVVVKIAALCFFGKQNGKAEVLCRQAGEEAPILRCQMSPVRERLLL